MASISLSRYPSMDSDRQITSSEPSEGKNAYKRKSPVAPENPNPLHFLNFSAAGLNLRALRILFAGRVECDETGSGVSACFDLDLASVQAIRAKGDRRMSGVV